MIAVNHVPRCEACVAIADEEIRRIKRYRMIEDVAGAFAFVGLIGWLSQMGYSRGEMVLALHRIFPDFHGRYPGVSP